MFEKFKVILSKVMSVFPSLDDHIASEPVLIKQFVCGFLFNRNCKRVCLIRKNRPIWQAGKLNGVGGSIEPGETGPMAMAREFFEETGVHTLPLDWIPVTDLYFKGIVVQMYAFSSQIVYDAVRTNTDEKVVKLAVQYIHKGSTDCLSNIPALITLCEDAIHFDGTDPYHKVGRQQEE